MRGWMRGCGGAGASAWSVLVALLLLVPLAAQAAPRSKTKGKSGAQQRSAEGDVARAADRIRKRGGEETWYVSTVSRPGNELVTVHYWSKGPKFRAETVLAGHRIITLVSGEYYYTLDEVSGTGVAIRRSAKAVAADATRGRPFGGEVERVMSRGGEKIKTEKLGQRSFDVYRSTSSEGRTTVWVTGEAPHVPVRVETYVRKTGAEGTLDYVGWLFGLGIADSFFEPSPDITLERVDYQEYVRRAPRELVGPAPVLYRDLLHGPDS